MVDVFVHARVHAVLLLHVLYDVPRRGVDRVYTYVPCLEAVVEYYTGIGSFSVAMYRPHKLASLNAHVHVAHDHQGLVVLGRAANPQQCSTPVSSTLSPRGIHIPSTLSESTSMAWFRSTVSMFLHRPKEWEGRLHSCDRLIKAPHVVRSNMTEHARSVDERGTW